MKKLRPNVVEEITRVVGGQGFSTRKFKGLLRQCRNNPVMAALVVSSGSRQLAALVKYRLSELMPHLRPSLECGLIECDELLVLVETRPGETSSSLSVNLWKTVRKYRIAGTYVFCRRCGQDINDPKFGIEKALKNFGVLRCSRCLFIERNGRRALSDDAALKPRWSRPLTGRGIVIPAVGQTLKPGSHRNNH
jgi:hypothetical protein